MAELRGASTAFAIVVALMLALASKDVGIPGQALLQSIRFHVALLMLPPLLVLLVGRAWLRSVLFALVAGYSVFEGGGIIVAQQQARLAAAEGGTTPLFTYIGFNMLDYNTGNGAKIADFLTSSDADVVAVMESTPIVPYMDKMRSRFPYVSDCPANGCSVRLFSRTPLERVRIRSLLGSLYPNRFILAETVIKGIRVTIVVAHLTKPYFDDMAASEITQVTRTLGYVEGPYLLVGDFNAAAWSDAVAQMIAQRDLAPGPAYPATWPVRSGPFGVPIDNVLAKAPLVITDVSAFPDAFGSNHRAVRAEVSLAGSQ